MPISAPLYLAVLPVVVLVSYRMPAGRWRAVFLLLVSYGYYLTFPPAFFPLLVAITGTAYLGGLLIERCNGTRLFRWVVLAVLLACFAPMVFYKYLVPLLSAAFEGQGADPALARWVLPVGLSFYTFAAVGYLADVSLGVIAAERRPLAVALFCGFFPIVTMGPIPRTSMLRQLQFTRPFTAERGMRALSEILIGALLKLGIADALAGPTNAVYADLASCSPLEHLAATAFEAFQVYADWAGYSLIAIGSARLLGVDIPDNFRQPYLSTNMGEFWRSWNISLLNWLRDYVFTPLRLMLRNRPKLATPFAIMVTFVLLGIWHAAGWGYLLYGAVNGLLVAGSQLTLPRRDRFWKELHFPPLLLRLWRIPATFLIVLLTIPLVRARTLEDALFVYRGLFSPKLVADIVNLFGSSPNAGVGTFHYIHLNGDVLLIAVLIAGDIVARMKTVPSFRFPIAVRLALYAVCLLAVVHQAISPEAPSPFVYFQY